MKHEQGSEDLIGVDTVILASRNSIIIDHVKGT